MNERILDIVVEADKDYALATVPAETLEKFAELIVRECINQAHSVANLRGANDDMVYGADTAALRISKYFGVDG